VFTTSENDPPYTYAKAPIATEMTISKAPSSVVVSSVKRSGSGTRVAGKVTTNSAKYGVVTTYGDVLVQYRASPRSPWRKLGKGYTSSDGFSVTSDARIPARAPVRVLFLGNDFALPSEGTR